jgi:hypothetical protein
VTRRHPGWLRCTSLVVSPRVLLPQSPCNCTPVARDLRKNRVRAPARSQRASRRPTRVRRRRGCSRRSRTGSCPSPCPG